MSDIYYQKYLKYKNKYLSLKSQLDDQYAGSKVKTLWAIKNPTGFTTKKLTPGTRKENTDGWGDQIKEIKFGISIETREYKDKNGKLVTGKIEIPYLIIQGKEHEISSFDIDPHSLTMDREEIVKEIKEQAIPKDRGDGKPETQRTGLSRHIWIYDKPCFGFGQMSSKCRSDKDRGLYHIMLKGGYNIVFNKGAKMVPNPNR